MPRISVLLPVRNDARHLPAALRSLEKQTRPADEIIVVEDASADASFAVLQAWTRKLPLHIVRGRGRGIAAALNQGLDHTEGSFIARMDADDVMHPRRMAVQEQFLVDHPPLGLAGTEVRSFPDARVSERRAAYDAWLSSLHTPEEHARDIYVEAPLAHPTAMFRRESLEKVGGYAKVPWPEDYDLWLRLHGAGVRMGKPSGVLHYWRERPERLSRVHQDYSREAIRRCRLHHLALQQGLHERGVVVVGAGFEGKRAGRMFQSLGVKVLAHVDADPRKVGGRLAGEGGVRVLPASELVKLVGPAPRPLGVVAIGTAGHRPKLRAELREMGLQEGVHAVIAA